MAKRRRSASQEDTPILPVPMAKAYVPFFNIIVYGFIYLTVIGGVLLMFPFASADGVFTSPTDTFFTAASAVSATGLVVNSTHDYWSRGGQLVIMALMQIGGIGFMTMSAFLLLLVRGRINLGDDLISETLGSASPRRFVTFVGAVLFFTILIEAAGGLLFFLRFRDAFPENGLFESAFYTISGFNNAGFDLEPRFDGVSAFRGDPQILGILASLFLIGGIGVPMAMLVLTRRPWKRWSLDMKLAISTTLALLVVGAIIIGAIETAAALAQDGDASFVNKALNALFLSGSARTAGFATVDIGALTTSALVLIMLLMFVGGVSGSTAGGIKVNTFATLFLTAVSYLRGQQRVHAFGKIIPEMQLHRAIAIAFLGVLLVFLLTIILSATEGLDFLSILFESVSAFSTTGFSTGITPDLSTAGKAVLTVGMLVGRMGPLIVVLALSRRKDVRQETEDEEESIRVG